MAGRPPIYKHAILQIPPGPRRFEDSRLQGSISNSEDPSSRDPSSRDRELLVPIEVALALLRLARGGEVQRGTENFQHGCPLKSMDFHVSLNFIFGLRRVAIRVGGPSMTHFETESRDLSMGALPDPKIWIFVFVCVLISMDFQPELGGRVAACNCVCDRIWGDQAQW